MMADKLELKIELARRERDLYSRIETDRAVVQSLVNGTDEDSLDGRRARRILHALQQVLDDREGE